jgi:hypothetical protein
MVREEPCHGATQFTFGLFSGCFWPPLSNGLNFGSSTDSLELKSSAEFNLVDRRRYPLEYVDRESIGTFLPQLEDSSLSCFPFADANGKLFALHIGYFIHPNNYLSPMIEPLRGAVTRPSCEKVGPVSRIRRCARSEKGRGIAPKSGIEFRVRCADP